MVFSSTIFLFIFLPIVLLAYLVFGTKFRNFVLLFSSLLFYAWGENIFVLLMLVSILLNYTLGRLIDRSHNKGKRGTAALVFAISANLGLLCFLNTQISLLPI